MSDRAGADSPLLDAGERDQAARHSAPRALVIHEVVRAQGEEELRRRPGSLVWSGVTAGLSMGFSFLALALIRSGLPDAPWHRLVDSAGYTVGFMIAILGRQQLFTETTLTAVLPLLVRRDRATLLALLRFWAVVLCANLFGSIMFAALISPDGVFAPSVHTALVETGREAVGGAFWPTLLKAMLAGWLIALDAAFVVFSGDASVGDYLGGFLVPTLIGNTIGGVALVALLNHAPLMPEMQEE